MTRRDKPLTNKTKVSAHGISQALIYALDEGSPDNIMATAMADARPTGG
jgi:hypothetical protein